MSEIIKSNIIDEFDDSFLRYSMSVITDRALPDVKDGMKPIHRRIAYDMVNLLNLKAKGRYVKSARVVGDVIAKLSSHGESSAYDAACRLTLDYVMRYPLIDGQGSFGSTDGDGAAAMRYTEMKPTELLELMVDGVKKNVVDMVPNFANDEVEPVVLPGLFPNLLCNPNSGIAVAMACNFAPHNLVEVCNGIIAYINNNDITIDELMEFIPGPDFPLGGVLINKRDIKRAYETGKSDTTLRIRGEYQLKGKTLRFYSLPYGVTRAKIREQVNNNVDKLEPYVSDFNDNTNKDGIKIDFELIDVDKIEDVLAIIFKNTDLESTFPINNVCLVNGQPKRLSLKEMIEEYVKHQVEVIIRTAQFDKDKAEKRAHILEGLLIALKYIDKVIELIRNSKDKAEARIKLIDFLSIDETQANAILDMKLSKLTKLDEDDLNKELEEKKKTIEFCNKLINDEAFRNEHLISKIESMKNKYGDARRTKLEDVIITKEKKVKKEVPATPVKISCSNNNIKLVKRANRTDTIIDTVLNSTLAIFTNKGMCYKLPVTKVTSSAQNLKTLLKMGADEEILLTLDYHTVGTLLFTTQQGMVKKTDMSEFDTTRSGKSIKLKDGDGVVNVFLLPTDKEKCLQLETNEYILTFSISDFSPTGKLGLGVKGIKLHDGDKVIVSKLIAPTDKTVLGKRNQVGRKKK